jgi:hypothetical protein
MELLLIALMVVAVVIVSLSMLVVLDRRVERAEWRRLESLQPENPARFDPAVASGLPEPARRYFAYTIRPGTPLLPVTVIEMNGRFGPGTRDDPKYQRMAARQILAAPEGFVWAMRTCDGIPLSGSDAGRWTRFRIFGLIPVARMGGDSDHTRSAFGRFVAEAVFWSPAALLPGPGVDWKEVDAETARVVVRRGDLEQAVDVTVDSEGRPVQVALMRWTDANPDKVYRPQSFGGFMSDFREVNGYRLPFRVEAGNLFGTDEYFPFFIADVTEIRFPGAAPGARNRVAAPAQGGDVRRPSAVRARGDSRAH